MSLPPFARRLDVAATRAAFAAGTLGTVGDNAPGEHHERRGELPKRDRPDGDLVEHVRESRLARWQAER